MQKDMQRVASVQRKTRETDISLQLDIAGSGQCDIDTGIGFFDHMLTALAVHAGFDLTLKAQGDLHVDCHHTIEDVGICLGKALAQANQDKTGIARFGSATIPMDEALAMCAVDISGRPYLVFDAAFTNASVGGMDTQMAEEFFCALAMHAGMTLHLRLLYGKNDHHRMEALFKATAHAFRMALAPRTGAILSTKGMLEA